MLGSDIRKTRFSVLLYFNQNPVFARQNKTDERNYQSFTDSNTLIHLYSFPFTLTFMQHFLRAGYIGLLTLGNG